MQKGGRSNPGGFLIEQRRLEKQPAELRVRAFTEITLKPTADSGTAQASRCTDCGVPFCQNACPLQNNIPDWLALSADGDLREAWRVASATSTMPEICGRICPQDRLCEGACTLQQSGWDGVTIGSVEAWIADTAFDNGWVEPIRPLAERGQSVGIIGSGPAGLAAADRLRSEGFAVTVYDRHDRAGGLLTYGIPGFKLEKRIVQRRVDRLVEGGVTFRQAHEIVGGLVARARDLNTPLDRLDSSEFLKASPVLTPEIVKATFQLQSALAARKAIGAPSPDNISRELARWRTQLS